MLEDRFETTASGSRFNVVADLVTYCPGAHVMRSVIHKQFFISDAPLQQQNGRVTIFQGLLSKIHGKFWCQTDGATAVIEHAIRGGVTPLQAIEICAGIGAMGPGLKGCKVDTKCYVDYNPRFCQWLRDHGLSGVVEGNIAHHQTVVEAHRTAPDAQIMLGGGSMPTFLPFG